MYQKRPIRCLDVWVPRELDLEWQLKVYGISYAAEQPSSELIEIAKALAINEALPQAVDHYGLGFIGVHQGQDSDFIFVDWWANRNELHHHVFTAGKQENSTFSYKTPSGLSACVWDLFVQNFERQAWITFAMQNSVIDSQGYLAKQFNGVI